MTDLLNTQFKNFVNNPLWDDLSRLDPLRVKEHSGADLDFVQGSQVYTLRFLGTDYKIRLAEKIVESPKGSDPLEYQPIIVMLSYLVRAATGPAPGVSGVETAPGMLPSGDLFFKGPHELMKAPVAEAYGGRPEELVSAGLSLGGEAHGPLSFRLRALPYVEIYCYIEPGDDEFPPEVRYNFDSNIHYYLQLDGIFALVNTLGSLLISLQKR